jgi:hypothetical protein
MKRTTQASLRSQSLSLGAAGFPDRPVGCRNGESKLGDAAQASTPFRRPEVLVEIPSNSP